MKQVRNPVLFLGLLFLIAYRFRRWIIARILRLPNPTTNVSVKTGLHIPMQDGIKLAADHYMPSSPGTYPTVLIRSPYGRNADASVFGWLLAFMAQRFAERGYHVLVQDVRGRFDSEGEFVPYFNEKQDGLDTLAWLEQQPWFNGDVATWGSSYLGIVQWVIAGDSPSIKAIVPVITGSNLREILYPDGAFDLGLAMRWLSVFHYLDDYRTRPLLFALRMWSQIERGIQPAFEHLPIGESDALALGEPVAFYRFWLEHADENDEIWQQAMRDIDVSRVDKPAHLIGGWYDFFLRALLKDYETLRANGHQPYLTIGPWHHFNAMVSWVDLREGITWFDAHLKGDVSRLRQKPVRLYVMGINQWRDYDEFPPKATPTPLYLREANGLSLHPCDLSESYDTYRYDPTNPTPSVGGTVFSPWAGGAHDNRRLEARDDVLIFTTQPLLQPIEIIGRVTLQLYVRSSLQYTDFFGRVCDVDPSGRSTNVCDGLVRIIPGKGEPQPDGTLCVEIDLWATAYHFKKGHAIRLQVSSGAHPRWSRNPGTGEPIATAKTCKPADQTIYHDQSHPSAVILPII
ncbi:MAG: CocE/NonD family hydrolase [Chloroflexi bacterium]|nr:MAG: CocE/NonD family hydrolase [Chloroflexota bacterium]